MELPRLKELYIEDMPFLKTMGSIENKKLERLNLYNTGIPRREIDSYLNKYPQTSYSDDEVVKKVINHYNLTE
jgi:hypothetical protein